MCSAECIEVTEGVTSTTESFCQVLSVQYSKCRVPISISALIMREECRVRVLDQLEWRERDERERELRERQTDTHTQQERERQQEERERERERQPERVSSEL